MDPIQLDLNTSNQMEICHIIEEKRRKENKLPKAVLATVWWWI